MLVEKSAVSCDEVNRIQLQLLDWGHACTAREWVGDIRDPAYARLYYICDGDPYIVFAGHQLPLQPGWWHLLPGGFSFRHACRSRMEQLYFHIQLVDDTGVNLLRRTDGFLSRRGDPELARSMAKALQGGDLAACLRLRQQVFGLVLDMLAGSPIPLRPARHSACVREATAYIRSHPTIQLTVRQLAELAHVSERTLANAFREEMGLTPGQYMDEQVFLQAEQLLRRTDLSIQQISDRLGFCDPCYFSRRFHKRYGLSPKQYRKNSLI